MNGRFHYLPYDLAVSFSVYIVIILLAVLLRCKCRKADDEFQFESTYLTVFGSSKLTVTLLLSFRIILFVFYTVVVCALNFKNFVTGYEYLTNWTATLFALYFLFASVVSFIGLCNRTALEDWPKHTKNFGNIVFILYEIVTTVSFLITVMALGFLSSKPTYSNMTLHVSTTVGIFLESCFNGMIIQLDHIIYPLTYVAIYLIIIVILVTTVTIQNWPYFFLYTDSTTSYIWYSVLVILVVIFHCIAWLITYLKRLFAPHLNCHIRQTMTLDV